MKDLLERKYRILNKIAGALTRWIGSPASIIAHTIVFAAAFFLVFFGYNFEKVLLVLTTAVSLEAIYLAILIQMTVVRSVETIEDVEEEIDELEGDIEEITEDIDKIQAEDRKQDDVSSRHTASLGHIESALQKLLAEIEVLKREK